MKNIGVRYGLLAAAAVVFYFAILYFVKKELFLHPGLQWASLLLYLAFMYKASLDDCSVNGTDRDFRALVRIPFIVFLLANLGYWLFFYGIHLADKSLIVMELEQKINILQGQMSEVNDPVTRNDLTKQINEMKTYMNNPVQPLGPILAQMTQGAIGGFVLAAGVALAIRSQKQH